MRTLILLFVLLLLPQVAVADDDGGSTVEMTGGGQSGHNRSGMVLPVVTYSSTANLFTIEFASDDSYYLDVEATDGTILYSVLLDTSGTPTAYYVELQSGYDYIITISSSASSFYGLLQL